MTVLPSGRQLILSRGDQQATIVEVGGGLREYRVRGNDVVAGYGEHEMARDGRGQVLAPWPNRIDGGRYAWRGVGYQLPLTEPERQTAIHGLVRWAWWQVDQQADGCAIARHVLPAQTGYPFTLLLEVVYELEDDGLHVTTHAANLGTEPAPFGLSFHPYFTVGTATLDDATLHVPASTHIQVDARGIPTGNRPEKHPFRSPSPLAGHVLDDCYAFLDRDDTGVAHVSLAAQDGSRRVTLWMDDAFDYVMVYSGDRLEESERRRSIAIEPMTCPPNAFASGEGVITLEPSQPRTFRWGVRAT